jgi:hypothetical protein
LPDATAGAPLLAVAPLLLAVAPLLLVVAPLLLVGSCWAIPHGAAPIMNDMTHRTATPTTRSGLERRGSRGLRQIGCMRKLPPDCPAFRLPKGLPIAERNRHFTRA